MSSDNRVSKRTEFVQKTNQWLKWRLASPYKILHAFAFFANLVWQTLFERLTDVFQKIYFLEPSERLLFPHIISGNDSKSIAGIGGKPSRAIVESLQGKHSELANGE